MPEGHLLVGTYSGIDRAQGYWAQRGSKPAIVIYQPALELLYGSNKDRLEDGIRGVVLHELAHHLGMSHERMRIIGL